MQIKEKVMSNKTSLIVAGLGLITTGVGKAIGGRTGNAVSGFGIAHIMLGLLDTLRQ